LGRKARIRRISFPDGTDFEHARDDRSGADMKGKKENLTLFIWANSAGRLAVED